MLSIAGSIVDNFLLAQKIWYPSFNYNMESSLCELPDLIGLQLKSGWWRLFFGRSSCISISIFNASIHRLHVYSSFTVVVTSTLPQHRGSSRDGQQQQQQTSAYLSATTALQHAWRHAGATSRYQHLQEATTQAAAGRYYSIPTINNLKQVSENEFNVRQNTSANRMD